jgi:hypothetical protein
MITNRFRPGWVYDTSDKEHVTANSIHELAKKMNIDPEALSKTVEKFSAACNDKEFQPDGSGRESNDGLDTQQDKSGQPN